MKTNDLKNRSVLVVKKAPKIEEPIAKRKPADKSIESRTDRAEELLRLIGNCFAYTPEGKAMDCMDQISAAYTKLQRQFSRKYPQ